MRKTIIQLAIIIYATIPINAQIQSVVHVHIGSGQSLEQALGDNWAVFDSIVITGQAVDQDMKMLRRCIYEGNTSGVDMSGCSVPNNTIGDAAFIANFDTDSTGAVQPVRRLRYFTFPATLEAINEYAFAFTGLRTVDFPATLTSVGDYAFHDCTDLSGDIALPKNCETSRCVFTRSWNITEINLSDGVQVSDRAFSGLPMLESVSIGDGCIVGTSSFADNPRLRQVKMQHECTLGTMAFSNCTELAQVRLADVMPEIPYNAFYGCGIQQLQWPDVGLIRQSQDYFHISNSAFYGSRFHTIEVPEGVTHILGFTFANNPNLEMAILPDGLYQVSNAMFNDCPNLTAIYSKAPIPAMMSNGVEESLRHRAILYVPMGSKQTYETRDGWKEFEHIVEVNNFPSTAVEGIMEDMTQDDTYHDLRGIKANNPGTGIYIHRGKLVIFP